MNEIYISFNNTFSKWNEVNDETVCLWLVTSEWSLTPEGGVAPNLLYFCREKLSAWMNIADHVDEACRTLSTHVRKYFGQSSRDVVAKVVGKLHSYESILHRYNAVIFNCLICFFEF